MKCNGCWIDIEPNTQSIATCCGHFFCVQCAQTIVESSETCPICESIITKSNVKLVAALQESAAIKLNLCGQSPEASLNCALASINFYLKQQDLCSEYRDAHFKRRIQKVQEQCRQKLAEVHNGYQVAKRKYQEVMQQKTTLEKDNHELQQKYAQKSMQTRKLQEMFKKLQMENGQLRERVGKMPQNFPSPTAFSPPITNNMQINHTGHQVIQQRTQVFGGIQSMQPDAIFGGGPGHGMSQAQRASVAAARRQSAIRQGNFDGLSPNELTRRRSKQFQGQNPNSLQHFLEGGRTSFGDPQNPQPFMSNMGSPSGLASF